MRIREFQLEELKRARELQDELCKLHTPCPVLSWSYEIKSANGDIIEKGIGKANSFTRNALNVMAWHVGMADLNAASDSFGDGMLSVKRLDGTIAKMSANATYALARTTSVPTVQLGTGTGAEAADNYSMTALTVGSTATSSVTAFNSTTRKLITVLTRSYINDSASSIDITEAGVTIPLRTSTSAYDYLMIRDKFTAIALAVGESIFWTYSIEVTYPA